ncbi:MAG TPA: glycosyl hydrolase 115 family protein [Halanaerobiales bacterium]|nr:glycosyl hydrolase 115 family protein [Halanaerobiales bacterium]HPZ62292.1 glycosyl hydrolase 115 family protein [Halanaerobiales bacterium]HQD03232.1 glycosyl hydrolase 115 family protein [Halanaerobiales bacterium]
MIEFKKAGINHDDFILVEEEFIADLYVDREDYWGVIRAAEDLQKDIKAVTGKKPEIIKEEGSLKGNGIFVGTIGKSQLIDRLAREGKLELEEIKGKWESFSIQILPKPLPGIEKGLFIIGSDKRGTIFGIYELSRQIGVSPWYWWADVPVQKREAIYVKAGIYNQGEPAVKYRGIFLNDEAPSLVTWVENKYGSFNHHFYEKVFELLLRLKANFLWPAMWKPRVFNEEDPLNPVMADKYGIVMGTSHHEPMMRSWEEWGKIGQGEWNYRTNQANIYDFWYKGLERVKDFESIVTVGMRGDGDEAMAQDGEDSRRLLEKIIQDQREIINKVTGKDPAQVPQALALYKEVQTYYEAGLAIPEDITLILTDDNFGNVRMLPAKEERNRPGGYGMYYHFDYVGGPRSYQWINTVPLQKIWDQMNLTYQHGVDRIWIVNVGDLKPMELPIDFFLAMAWDINRWGHDSIGEYHLQWAEEQFGSKYAREIAEILQRYTKYNGRRKPEIVEEDTFSLVNYREGERVLAEFEEIVGLAEKIYNSLESEKKDAFFQLVLYPARASRNVMKMHLYAGKNHFYASQGRSSTNDYAELTEKTFKEEAADTDYYNKELAGGKWYGMMLQPHIGKANWRGPEKNTMPGVKEIEILPGSDMGVYLEGALEAIDPEERKGSLPVFSKYTGDEYYLEIFNKKADSFAYTIEVEEAWIKVSKAAGRVEKEERIMVSIDWDQVPLGEDIEGKLIISGTGKDYEVRIQVFNPASPDFAELEEMTFVESKGYISIEAEHYSRKVAVEGISWERLADYGRTLSSMLALPVGDKSFLPPETGPYLEYRLYFFTPGEVEITLYTAPTLNFDRRHGLRYAISLDGGEPVIADLFPVDYDADYSCPPWMQAVLENVHKSRTRHLVKEKGYHSLRIQMVDPGIVFQKIVIDTGGVKPSYLGPPESYFRRK